MKKKKKKKNEILPKPHFSSHAWLFITAGWSVSLSATCLPHCLPITPQNGSGFSCCQEHALISPLPIQLLPTSFHGFQLAHQPSCQCQEGLRLLGREDRRELALVSTKEWYICHLNIASYPSCKRCYPLIGFRRKPRFSKAKWLGQGHMLRTASFRFKSPSGQDFLLLPLPTGGLQLLSNGEVSKQAFIYSCSLKDLPSLPNLQ